MINGEVFDYILNDGESAINYYLEFLENIEIIFIMIKLD